MESLTYLILDKHGTQTIEELPGRDYVTLHEHTGDDGGRCPDARADGHLPKPLLEGYGPNAAFT